MKGGITMNVPQDIMELGKCLEKAGFEWVIVGGCVRDALLGKTPHDYDLATSARPEEMKWVFAGCKVFETGIAHGTLTVLTRERSVEITTYRIDGEYKDGRHPEGVMFSSSLKEDLARRDFTVNALAFHPENGLFDFFGGQEDLKNGIIRCVGDADTRFHEDGLRILRALRFASVLEFQIEEETARAIHENYALLEHISRERIWEELKKLLSGKNAAKILREYADVFFFVMPCLASMKDFPQKNPHHIYDVWEHTLVCVEHTPPDPYLRLAALFHDSGKPETFSEDEMGIGHFYAHAKVSAEKAHSFLCGIKAEGEARRTIPSLVEDHDRQFGDSEKALRRFAGKKGIPYARNVLSLKRADISAQAPHLHEERFRKIAAWERLLDRLEEEHACLTLRDLQINGQDLMKLGVPAGKQIGEILNRILEEVTDGDLPNEKEILMGKAKEYIKEIDTMFRELERKKKALPAEECIRLLKEERRGVLSVLGDEDYPYGMPMNHFYFEEDGAVYFHCGKSGHRLDALKKHKKVSYCVFDSGSRPEGEWAYNVKSVIIFGKIEIIDDMETVVDITARLSRKFTRDEAYIQKEIELYAPKTLLLKLVPEHISGKEVTEA